MIVSLCVKGVIGHGANPLGERSQLPVANFRIVGQDCQPHDTSV